MKNVQKYNTQWAGQFFVAAELTRRGYRVSFILGNAPQTDLNVVSSQGKCFRVEVKSQQSKNFWIVKRHKRQDDHYYVFAFVPSTAPPDFYIMTCDDMLGLIDEYEKVIRQTGKKYDERFGGFNWTAPLPHKNKWDVLPS